MSIACDGMVKEWFAGQADVNNVGLDDLFEQTFFRQLMLGVDNAIAPDLRIADYHLRHPELAPSAERHLGDRNLYSSAAKRYETNFKNALRVGADGRIRTFVKRFKELHQLTQRVSGIRRFGSAALDLAWVAAGRFDGFWERSLNPWDIAAGLLLVTEAGGKISGIDPDEDVLETGNVVASNLELMPLILERLRAAQG